MFFNISPRILCSSLVIVNTLLKKYSLPLLFSDDQANVSCVYAKRSYLDHNSYEFFIGGDLGVFADSFLVR